ncbi:CDP-diacylglycerol diphosphatase [Paludibacterium sp. B53371]|uniref:CDP-diacylglycerol diphosphatase n=1 Tax=Paludibacterium sp. B53371 TaxID=2806263 RepID=UPI001C040930|nr:CDP-diacylglycerol diphosphatase [Paludibacterium sp. B53371]
MTLLRLRPLLICLLCCLPLAACADPDALWRIVHEQCVPSQQQGQQPPAPCDNVDLSRGEAQGTALLKDRHGWLQYLLLPTARVSGIESPWLLNDSAPNYFAAAWQARSAMARRRGQAIDRTDVALTVNSRPGRSQNQLHIHISCVSLALKHRLAELAPSLGTAWQPLPGGLNGHAYQVRLLHDATLSTLNPFKVLAASLPGAQQSMAEQTLAAVGARFADGSEGFYLLTDKADLLHGDFASSEGDVQDHDCQVLRQP